MTRGRFFTHKGNSSINLGLKKTGKLLYFSFHNIYGSMYNIFICSFICLLIHFLFISRYANVQFEIWLLNFMNGIYPNCQIVWQNILWMRVNKGKSYLYGNILQICYTHFSKKKPSHCTLIQIQFNKSILGLCCYFLTKSNHSKTHLVAIKITFFSDLIIWCHY